MPTQQTDAGGFGAMLSYHIEQRKLAEEASGKSLNLTQVVGLIAKETGVSAAHIMRMKTRVEFPSHATIEKLSDIIPAFKMFLTEVAPAKGVWRDVEQHQDDLPAGSTITIVAGKPPHVVDLTGQDSHRMALQIAENVFARQISYVFVLRPADIDKSKELVPALAAAEWKRSDSRASDKSLIDWQRELATKLRFTSVEDDAGEFWSQMPHYGVFYNVLSADENMFPPFGMYWVRGVSPFIRTPVTLAAIKDPRLRWAGWILFDPYDFARLQGILAAKFKGELAVPAEPGGRSRTG